MSVYIKGFPLPNNCGACPLRLAWCRERIYMVTRPERCPLVPVPEHGRLIDADAADDYAYDELSISSGYRTPYEASRNMQKIYLAMPTIIPEDKE